MAMVTDRAIAALIMLAVLSACTGSPPTNPKSLASSDPLLVLSRTDRPLPQVLPGERCPTTAGFKLTTPGFGGFALGPGPAYPIIVVDRDRKGTYHYKGAGRDDGWRVLKTLWVIRPGGASPLLIRGGRL